MLPHEYINDELVLPLIISTKLIIVTLHELSALRLIIVCIHYLQYIYYHHVKSLSGHFLINRNSLDAI